MRRISSRRVNHLSAGTPIARSPVSRNTGEVEPRDSDVGTQVRRLVQRDHARLRAVHFDDVDAGIALPDLPVGRQRRQQDGLVHPAVGHERDRLALVSRGQIPERTHRAILHLEEALPAGHPHDVG